MKSVAEYARECGDCRVPGESEALEKITYFFLTIRLKSALIHLIKKPLMKRSNHVGNAQRVSGAERDAVKDLMNGLRRAERKAQPSSI